MSKPKPDPKDWPPSIMQALRVRCDLQPDDASQDEMLWKMAPASAVRQCAAFYLGDGQWAETVAYWMRATGALPEDFRG